MIEEYYNQISERKTNLDQILRRKSSKKFGNFGKNAVFQGFDK